VVGSGNRDRPPDPGRTKPAHPKGVPELFDQPHIEQNHRLVHWRLRRYRTRAHPHPARWHPSGVHPTRAAASRRSPPLSPATSGYRLPTLRVELPYYPAERVVKGGGDVPARAVGHPSCSVASSRRSGEAAETYGGNVCIKNLRPRLALNTFAACRVKPKN